jgi:hypothetical protein
LCISAALRAAAIDEGPSMGASNNTWKMDGTPICWPLGFLCPVEASCFS